MICVECGMEFWNQLDVEVCGSCEGLAVFTQYDFIAPGSTKLAEEERTALALDLAGDYPDGLEEDDLTNPIGRCEDCEEDDLTNPIGRCEDCTALLFPGDDPDLCDRCLWLSEH